jgi:hypothetical protein
LIVFFEFKESQPARAVVLQCVRDELTRARIVSSGNVLVMKLRQDACTDWVHLVTHLGADDVQKIKVYAAGD